MHSRLPSITPLATKVHMIIRRLYVNMDAWYYRISVAWDTMELGFILLSPLLVWSTPLDLPGRCGICMHQHSTSGRRRRRRRWHSTYVHWQHDLWTLKQATRREGERDRDFMWWWWWHDTREIVGKSNVINLKQTNPFYVPSMNERVVRRCKRVVYTLHSVV